MSTQASRGGGFLGQNIKGRQDFASCVFLQSVGDLAARESPNLCKYFDTARFQAIV